MAPPKSPWNKNPAKHGTPAKSLKGDDKPASIDYAQVQSDEIEVLRAIYMEDFEEIETKGAWSKTSDRAFRIRIRTPSDPDTFVVLSVNFTATYPKTSPLLSLENASNVDHKTTKKLDGLLKSKPRDLLGEVMIYELTLATQEILEDAVQLRRQLQRQKEAVPSLEEERVVQEAAASKLAQQQEEELLIKQKAEKAEEERVLQQMVDEEISRRKGMKRRSKPLAANVASLMDAYTQSVLIGKGPVTEVYAAQLQSAGDHDGTLEDSPKLALKRSSIREPSADQRNLIKKIILELENQLEALRPLRQSNILDVLDFKIDYSSEVWQVNILTEFANKGSLNEVLELVDALPVARVRSWFTELLEALDFYHRNGVIHKDVHAGNVLLFRSSAGATLVKLADGGFQSQLHHLHNLTSPVSSSVRPSSWSPPERIDESDRHTRKTDVWDLGIVFLQMLFGLNVTQQYISTTAFMDAHQLSAPLEEFTRKLFKAEPKKRPSAFDLLPYEFLRTEAPVEAPSAALLSRARLPSTSLLGRRSRRESVPAPLSRYASEWVEVGRLGKGGFGEVVKARNKLDGRIYAIKKITQTSSALSEVLSEVMLLSRLNHPYVVRYYTAWPEENVSDVFESDEESTTADTTSELSPGYQEASIEFGHSTGGLDFISSSGYPKIEFGDDSEEEEDDSAFESEEGEEDDADDDDEVGDERVPQVDRKTNSDSVSPTMSTLYIQMEYCERHTLRDLIRKGLYENVEETWRLFRQILEGLAHIHSHGIIHRDLKPDNVFIDVTNNPRIGDFGLATSGQYQIADHAISSSNADGGDMTRSIGTTLYVAPELRSEVKGSYNDKVDMYSLGIIFFEMCYPLRTAMERDQTIRRLREKEHSLPPEFQTTEKAIQGSIITALISHRPSERPSSAELLRSGKIPLQIEDETIRQALQGLTDERSPYYQKMMSALFAQTPNKQVKDFTWDMVAASGGPVLTANDLLIQATVKDKLCTIFRRHGAVETQRQLLFPRSSYYTNSNVVQLLDPSGTLVQLPYDLTFPHARVLAKQVTAIEKSFAFGNVYRDLFTGGAPRSNGEVDFDIVSYDASDLALQEAEVIKAIDEVIDEFPPLASSQMCFHLSHSDLLEVIMEFSRVSVPQRPAVKEILSKLNIHDWTWQRIRNELRTPTLAIPSTSLDDMARFDFRDTAEKTFGKIRTILQGTGLLEKAEKVFRHVQSLVGHMKQFNVRRKVYVSPLSCFNEKFYTGGILFQCLYDTKRRDVLAAGGRYDRLVEDLRSKVPHSRPTGCHAVGMNLGWDKLVSSMARRQKSASKSAFLRKPAEEESSGAWTTRRCEVLVASFDPATLRSAGVRLVSDLWANDLSAELAIDTRSPEELLARYRDDKHGWIVIVKPDVGGAGAGAGKPELKVKSMARREDTDVRSAELPSHLRAEMRERDQRDGGGSSTASRARLLRQPSQPDAPAAGKNSVQVLLAQHKSKKSNKWSVVEAAQARARDLLASYAGAPVAAVETRDDVLEQLRATRLSDPDGWRRVVRAAPLAERLYLQQLHDLLGRYAAAWREGGGGEGGGEEEGRCRVAFVYNFRTGACVLYDLGL